MFTMCEKKSHQGEEGREQRRGTILPGSNRITECCVESHLPWGRVGAGSPGKAAVMVQETEAGASGSGGATVVMRNGWETKLRDLHPE